MKTPDIIIEYHNIEITLIHGWIVNEWGAAWNIGERHFWFPGFASKEAAEAQAKRMIDAEMVTQAER